MRDAQLDKMLRTTLTRLEPFASSEEEIMIRLLGGESLADLAGAYDFKNDAIWAGLQQAPFLHPYLQRWLKQYQCTSPSFAVLRQQCELALKKNLIRNALHLRLVRRIAKQMTAHGIKVVFMKGAAELLHAGGDAQYRGRRAMDDIDLLCSAEEFAAADKALLAMGCEYALEQFGDDAGDSRSRSTAIEHAAQLVYRFSEHGHSIELELHSNIAVGRKLRAYPPDFAKALIDGSIAVVSEDVSLYVPALELALVQMIGHASCEANHYFIAGGNHQRFAAYVEYFVGDSTRLQRLNSCLNAYQLDYLFKLSNFLQAFDERMDFPRINTLLESIPNKNTLGTYLHLGQSVLPQFRCMSAISCETKTLAQLRQRLILQQLAAHSHLFRGLKHYARTVIKRLSLTQR